MTKDNFNRTECDIMMWDGCITVKVKDETPGGTRPAAPDRCRSQKRTGDGLPLGLLLSSDICEEALQAPTGANTTAPKKNVGPEASEGRLRIKAKLYRTQSDLLI